MDPIEYAWPAFDRNDPPPTRATLPISLDPADRPRAEVLVRALYAHRGRPLPPIVWVRSQPEGWNRWEAHNNECRSRYAVLDGERMLTGRPGIESTLHGLQNRFHSDAAFELDHVSEDFKAALNCFTGPWWAGQHLVILCDRPTAYRADDRGRAHAPDGPAVAWPDGTEIYAIHGIQVERHVVIEPASITLEEIDGEQNLELRRILIDRFGATRMIREGGARLIHEDETGRLWKRSRPGFPRLDERGPGWPQRRLPQEIDDPQAVTMVEVQNSTPEPDGSRKTYFIRVPPTMRTAREAVAWTFALGEIEYRPEAES